MKNRIKYLAIIVLTLSVFNGCIEPIGTVPTICNLGVHLGIGENCATTGNASCGLKNYNTSTGADAFPVPIYRIGSESSFVNASATPTAMANHILSTYASLSDSNKTSIKNGVPSASVKLTEVRIYNNSGKAYTWDKSIFGLNAFISSDLTGAFQVLAIGTLPVQN